ncbi:CBS domain-containing protein [Deltaproteobacteria bacterium TL4]
MIKVKDIMTTDLYVLQENDSVNLSRFLMESKRIRHVPIVNLDYDFIGLLTHRDLLALSVSTLAGISEEELAAIQRSIAVKDVMNVGIKTISPELDLRSAAKMILDQKFGCLPVVKGKKLVGIVTEADFVRITLQLLEFVENQEAQ